MAENIMKEVTINSVIDEIWDAYNILRLEEFKNFKTHLFKTFLRNLPGTSTVLYKGRSRSWAYPLISSEALYLISTRIRERQIIKEIIKLVAVKGLTANIASLVILDTL